MARVRWNTATLPSYVSSMWSNTEDWQFIRKSPELVSIFATMGEGITQELNWELHAAQAARKQKVEDGYKWAISHDDDRIRMRIWAFTARAMAHEAKHQSILKTMKHIGGLKGFDFEDHGRAQWDWGKRKRRSSTSGRKRTGSTGSGRSRPPGGSSSGSRTSGSGHSGASRPSMDPRREATYRRQLSALDILSEHGATESERNNAAEKARRIRERLGE